MAQWRSHTHPGIGVVDRFHAAILFPTHRKKQFSLPHPVKKDVSLRKVGARPPVINKDLSGQTLSGQNKKK